MMAAALLSASVPLALAETATHPAQPQQLAQSQMQMNMGTTQRTTYTIPAGSSLMVQPVMPLPDSLGETYTGQLVQPVMVGGQTIIPAGSHVTGSVVGVNDQMNTLDIQFREVSNPATGEVIPIQSRTTVSKLVGGVQQTQAQTQVQGQAPGYVTGPATFYPQVSFGGRAPVSDGAKIIGGTAAGTVFGAATGTLTGLTMAGTSDIGINEGTGALRGLGWGAAYGAGLGLLGGLIGAAADRDDVAVTTVRPVGHPITNITTGSLEPVAETPVALPVGGASVFRVTLEEPVVIVR